MAQGLHAQEARAFSARLKQALEAAGLLQPGRALAILDAPIEPKELP